MVLIIGYGVFINRTSFERTLKWRTPRLIWVKGYKRVFNLIPSRLNLYPDIKQAERAVLNAVEDENSKFNALLFDITDDEFETLKLRERSYRTRKIKAYGFETDEEIKDTYLFVGKNKLFGEEIIDNTLLPIPQYLKKCLDGAEDFGEKFKEAWLDTTFTGNNTPIRKYLNQSKKQDKNG